MCYIECIGNVLTKFNSSSYQNKQESSYKHMFANEWFMSLAERLHSTIDTRTT